MKSKSNRLYIFLFAFVAALFGGWCANVYKLVTTGFEIASWGGMEVARVVGVFVAPLGAILGLF